jgi:hypothetical protein
MLAHNVYFTLKDDSDAAQQALLASCRKHLTDHDGTVSFNVGRLAEGLERAVNDREFHVALQIIFSDRAAHDAYQVAQRHDDFIAENKSNWKQVRVFDVDLSSD